MCLWCNLGTWRYGNQEVRLNWTHITEETILCLHVNAIESGMKLSE